MYIKQMYIRLEIAFWETAILLLQESPELQRVLRAFHKFYQNNPWIGRIPKPILLVISGLTLGIMIGAFAAFLTP